MLIFTQMLFYVLIIKMLLTGSSSIFANIKKPEVTRSERLDEFLHLMNSMQNQQKEDNKKLEERFEKLKSPWRLLVINTTTTKNC